jgi:putative transcriptional regulator
MSDPARIELPGKLLVDPGVQRDPLLRRSVVLMVGEEDDEAGGLILNRAVRGSLGLLWERLVLQRFGERLPLGLGGPLTGPIMALHAEPSLAEECVLPGVYFTSSDDDVAELLERQARPVRMFLGYCRWEPKKLREEIDQGLWIATPATPEDVFQPGDRLWQQLVTRGAFAMPRSLLNLRQPPHGPSMN